MDKQEIVDNIKSLSQKKLTEEAKQGLYLDKNEKGVLDAVQEKVVSRKLLVFLTGTAMFVYAGLDADTWGMIAMCYIGGQSAIDFAKIWKG